MKGTPKDPGRRGRGVIPDIEIGRVYDPAFRDAEVHYASFGSMADFFGRDTAAHRHDRFWQLHFVAAGHLELRLDDVAYEADGPLFFLTPPSVPHAFRTNPEAHGHVITVAHPLVLRLLDSITAPLPGPCCLPLTGADGRHKARELARLFGLLRREIEDPRTGTAAAAEALVRLILLAGLRLLEARPGEVGGRRHDLATLRRFHELVDRHHTDHWTLPRYAAALNMTEARLTDLCNRLSGRSPKRVILDRLMLEARRFLAFSHLTVNEVASAMGYADTAYFCRFFKRQQGLTPSGYRASLAKKP